MNPLFEYIHKIHEDEHILVISKPYGLAVTGGAGQPEEESLVGWLLTKYGEQLRAVGSGAHRPGIVHRLDKPTSGVMVIAKTQLAFESLVAQFKARQVKKEYLSLVWGDVKPWRFKINAPLGRNPHNRMRFAVVEGGREAVTMFQVEEVLKLNNLALTRLRAWPETGRTHQIRVHLKSFEHPILGDHLYQSRNQVKLFSQLVEHQKLANRLYLHAARLEFRIPNKEEEAPVAFTTPEPVDFNFIDPTVFPPIL